MVQVSLLSEAVVSPVMPTVLSALETSTIVQVVFQVLPLTPEPENVSLKLTVLTVKL